MKNDLLDNLKYSEVLRQNKLFDTTGFKEYKVFILTNITVNPIKDLLEYEFKLHQINATVTFGNYDNILQDSYDTGSYDLVMVLYDLYAKINKSGDFSDSIEAELLELVENNLYSEIDIILNNLKNVPCVLFNSFSASYYPSLSFKTTPIDVLTKRLNGYLGTKKLINTFIIDLNKIIVKIGAVNAFDFRMFNNSKSLYTLLFIKQYIYAIQPLVLKNAGKLKKVLIFDCDNTLWKGILGEDGIDKIEMSTATTAGRYFNTIQQIAAYLSTKGILIGICSKNNPEDVDEVFDKHADIKLKKEHIVIKKVNWEDKVSNIQSIAQELNIGLDSIVFIDDSDFEINLIRAKLPMVTVLQVPATLSNYPELLLNAVYRYFIPSGDAADTAKTSQYMDQIVREIEKAKFNNVEDYLRSMHIRLTITINNADEITRIAQLTQKTNQFNLTTVRYTEVQIREMMNTGSFVFGVNVTDDFGDNGTTLLCILSPSQDTERHISINTFLMSCRIIGRNIEYAFFDYLFKWLKQNNFEKIAGKYCSTTKNAQVENFYDRLNFIVGKQTENCKEYTIDVANYINSNIAYIEIRNREMSDV